MRFSVAIACAAAGLATAAPLSQSTSDLQERASDFCFVVGSTTLPAETLDAAQSVASAVTCSTTKTTIDKVPDVTSGNVSFSDINFADSKDPTLAFALKEFATTCPLANNDLADFQNKLNVYVATEAGLRSVSGTLAIKVPKFFLSFQIARIQTAQGNAPTNPALTVEHLLGKVTKNAAGQSQDLIDQVTALSKALA